MAVAAAALADPMPSSAPDMTLESNVKITSSRVVNPSLDPKRGVRSRPAISYADCMRKDDVWSLEMHVAVAAVRGTLQLWAGSGCAVDAARERVCRQVPWTATARDTYRVTMADLMTALGIHDCIDPSGVTTGHTLRLNALLAGSPETTPGTIDAANMASLSIDVDLLGPAPPPPTGMSLDPMDGMLRINLPADVDPDAKTFHVFIDPNPRLAPGARACSGAGDRPQCPSPAFLSCIDPKHPSLDSGARYDRIFPRGSSLLIEGLENGRIYTIAVAGTDDLDNTGPLSALGCGAPQPTTTFFEHYCFDGGTGCASGCWVSHVGARTTLAWPGFLAAIVALGAAGWRRRSRTPS